MLKEAQEKGTSPSVLEELQTPAARVGLPPAPQPHHCKWQSSHTAYYFICCVYILLKFSEDRFLFFWLSSFHWTIIKRIYEMFTMCLPNISHSLHHCICITWIPYNYPTLQMRKLRRRLKNCLQPSCERWSLETQSHICVTPNSVPITIIFSIQSQIKEPFSEWGSE